MPIGRLVAFFPYTHTRGCGTAERADWKKPGDTGEHSELIGKGGPLQDKRGDAQAVFEKSYLKPKTVSAVVVTTTLCVEQEAIQDWRWRFRNVVQWGTDWISCDLNKA